MRSASSALSTTVQPPQCRAAAACIPPADRPLKRSQPGWQYLQAVRQRENGRVVGISLRVVFGDKDEVLALLGKSTAYIERTHLTMRLFNSRLTRKTLGFSKELEMYRASAAWEDIVCSFARRVRTLRMEVRDNPT